MATAIEAEEPVAVEVKNYKKDGEPFWNRIEIAPIRDETGEVTHFVGYQADVTDRKEAELALAAERETLDHVLSRVTTLVPDITETIVRSRSREALESALAERFETVADFSGAWLGRYNPSTDRISPVAGGHHPAETLVANEGSPHGTALEAAVSNRRVEVITEPAGLFDGIEDPVGAAALIPLEYRETVYGLLAVATPDAALFDERETAVLGALGQAAGSAINALESTSLSAAERVIEARIEISDPAMALLDLAESLESEITSDGQTGGTEDAPTLLLSLAGIPASSLDSLLESAAVTLVADRESGAVIEWSVPDGPLARTLTDDAVNVRTLSATPSGVRVQFEAASEHMANTIVGRFRTAYDGVELLAFHEVASRKDTAANFRDAVGADMTDRQHEALQKAFVSGFFDWPRDVEGEQLAESMGIHPSTFHQHLRAAERKLIGAFFEQ
jgi:hypothetical protein